MKDSKKLVFLSLLGRSGSGKGTQAKLLAEKFNFLHVSTGQLLREAMEKDTFFGRKVKDTLENGKFVPAAVVFSLWMPLLENIKEQQLQDSFPYQGIIFDGSPRKPEEALLLWDALEWFEWKEYFAGLHISISEEGAMKRLKARGRFDDNEQEIRSRLDLFESEVQKSIDFLRSRNKIIDVNGEQSIEQVQEEILSKLKHLLE